MPAPTETKVLGINDAKISKLLTDTGAAPTYSAPVDIPGITSITMSPTFTTKELKGDETVLDNYTKLDSISFTWTNSKMSLTALAIMLGGNVAASGSAGTAVQTYSLTGNDVPQFFKLEGQSLYTDAGDMHVILYKCKVNKVDYELKGEEYAIVSVAGTAIPLVSNKKLKDVIINEKATAISET